MAMVMACVQVLGNDVVVGAGETGNFELNVMKPMIASAFLQSARLLGDAFEACCARGIEPNRGVIARHVKSSLMLVTALTPKLGYDAAVKIAKHAHHEGTSLRDAAVALGLLSAEAFDALVRPEDMTRPTR